MHSNCAMNSSCNLAAAGTNSRELKLTVDSVNMPVRRLLYVGKRFDMLCVVLKYVVTLSTCFWNPLAEATSHAGISTAEIQ